MNRLFWMGVGAAVGVWATRRTQAAAHALTPAGMGANLADGLRELGAGLGAFGAEVRAGMVDREQELAELVERRTGTELPSVAEALREPVAAPRHGARSRRIPEPRPGARARRAEA